MAFWTRHLFVMQTNKQQVFFRWEKSTRTKDIDHQEGTIQIWSILVIERRWSTGCWKTKSKLFRHATCSSFPPNPRRVCRHTKFHSKIAEIWIVDSYEFFCLLPWTFPSKECWWWWDKRQWNSTRKCYKNLCI